MNTKLLMVVMALVIIVACTQEEKIRAMIWQGGQSEITRDVIIDGVTKEEFLRTSDPKFKDFRCVTKRDMETLVRAAMRSCKE
jgi:hypothetical protein